MLVIRAEGARPEILTSLVARACFASGMYVQSFCLPGVGFVKCDKKPLLSRQKEYSDILLLADPATRVDDACKHAKEKSIVIINAQEKPKSALLQKRKLRAFAMGPMTAPHTNPHAHLLGALVRACPAITAKGARTALGDQKDALVAFDEGMRNAK